MDKVWKGKQAGFTLIEVMTVLLVVAVLGIFASRAAATAIHASRSISGFSSLMSALAAARTTAANTEIDVVLCPSSDGETCGAGYHWENGWIAFQATQPGSNRLPGEAIVYRQAALPTKVRLLTTTGRTRIRFQGNGGNAGSNATFTFCDGRGARAAAAYAMANNGNLRLTVADPDYVTQACAGL